MAYLGDPVTLDGPLFAADNSLVRQSVGARLMSLLNIGGFGLVAWDGLSADRERPYLYRTPAVPVFDRNLKALAEKVHPTAAIAHVRGVVYDPAELVGPQNLHPFRFKDARVVLAQNGDLHRFGEMRYDLLDHIGPELVRCIEGTTDTEWVYALVLSRLADPFGYATADELAQAVEETLAILRDVRERRGIGTQSPVNLVLGDGDCLVATRFCFDYGWYPDDGSFFAGEREFDFTTLWYAAGETFAAGEDGWDVRHGSTTGIAMLASEPLGADITGWVEVPEYSMIVVSREADGVSIDVRELEL
jgi:predicted glutamine amidotransferase